MEASRECPIERLPIDYHIWLTEGSTADQLNGILHRQDDNCKDEACCSALSAADRVYLWGILSYDRNLIATRSSSDDREAR